MTDNKLMSNNQYPPGYPPNYPTQQAAYYQTPQLNLPLPQFNPYTNPQQYTTTYVAPVYTQTYVVPCMTPGCIQPNGTTTTTTYVTSYPATVPYGLSPPVQPTVTYQRYAGYAPPTATYPQYTTPTYLQTYMQTK